MQINQFREKVGKAVALHSLSTGRAAELLTQLAKKYGESTSTLEATTTGQTTSPKAAANPTLRGNEGGGGTHKQRLDALLQTHDPEKDHKADYLLAKYAGKEEAFITQLAKQYG